MMNGYPADWAQLTAAQKREYRLNRFLSPTNEKLVTPKQRRLTKSG